MAGRFEYQSSGNAIVIITSRFLRTIIAIALKLYPETLLTSDNSRESTRYIRCHDVRMYFHADLLDF